MPEQARKHCLLAIDAAAGPMLIEMDLPQEATIADALHQARVLLHAADGIDWESSATGVWGQRRERSAVPRDGDRIELYLALSADPRAQRRARARAKRTQVNRGPRAATDPAR